MVQYSGRWQIAIMEKAAQGEWFYLRDLLPEDYNLNQYQAIHRAARILHARGIVSHERYDSGIKQILIGPPGAEAPSEKPPE